MALMKERVWAKLCFEGRQEQQMLHFIAEEKVVTLEILLEQFPWIQWDDLFSMLGRFRRERLVSIERGWIRFLNYM